MTEKRYLVALPITSLDGKGRALPADRVREWTERAQKKMTRLFGGATLLTARPCSSPCATSATRSSPLVLGFASDSFLVEDEA